jgi:hypothetical protein
MQPTAKSQVKSNQNHIRLVTEKPAARVQLSGLEAAPDMQAGEYLAQCVNAFLERSKNRAVLEFTIIDGPHTGTALTQWINGVNGSIQPRSRYAKECAAALGHDLSADDDLEPGVVFKGKILVVYVGWRMTDKPGGGKYSDEFSSHRKDGRDFLRVHHIIREGSL